ncbi:hypothetical protein [Nonomuraea soli]|uniref:Cytoskeletal protein RodZ n=1 Tax=Nonomuraea soli TaxID=1032476 RepID=A0A7W0CNP7_9ACTN|nr:hypothetical protein [Nonomuraea soli]MBA2894392.1 cytoskeletal protein RodZ [Nonomuraea soli]
MGGEQPRFELSVPQIAGGALAAVTAAVAASYLGVAGTFIGAAVASVASTIGGAVYTHYLKRTGEKVKEHTVVAWRRREDEPPVREEGQGELATAVHATVREPEAADAGDTLVMAPVTTRRPLPWLKLGLAAALIFAISVAGILAIQAAAGRTVPEIVKNQNPQPAQEHKAPVHEEREKPSESPSTHVEPSRSPTPAETPGESASDEPAPTPSRTVQPTPSASSTGQIPGTEPTPDPVEESGETAETPAPDQQEQQDQPSTESR